MAFLARIIGAVKKRLTAHNKERAEAFLLGRRDFERLTLPREGALSIVCDDGELRDLDIVQVLDAHRVKGVFAVSTDLIGRAGFLDYEQLRTLGGAGHEIAFHGTTHDPFSDFPDAQSLRQAIGEGLERLRDEGLGTPTTLIYPFGRNNRSVRRAVAGQFDCAFTTWVGINRGQANRYALRRIPFGAYTGKSPATEAWYREMLQICRQDGGWMTLMLHPAAEGHTAQHTAMLSRLLGLAQELGISVRTVAAHRGAAAPITPTAPTRLTAPTGPAAPIQRKAA